MENELIQVSGVETLAALNRSEVDIQISTAKTYPRVLAHVLNQIETYATMDTETAEDCFYALRRKGRQGEQDTIIEGVSVRLAEIIAGAWGNMRVQTRIVGNDGKTITVQGMCHDLETNLAVSVEVKRRITDRFGKTFSEDMVVVTGNAASAIAFRNAVLKVVPKAVTKNVIDRVKDVAMGQSIDLETSRQKLIAYYAKIGVPTDQLLSYLSITATAEMDKEKCFALKGLANAIKEGSTTVKETFADHTPEGKKLSAQQGPGYLLRNTFRPCATTARSPNGKDSSLQKAAKEKDAKKDPEEKKKDLKDKKAETPGTKPKLM